MENNLTDKQVATIVYFAQGLSTKAIALAQKISVNTVRQRIKAVKNKDPASFDRACGIRNAHKRELKGLLKPQTLNPNADYHERLIY